MTTHDTKDAPASTETAAAPAVPPANGKVVLDADIVKAAQEAANAEIAAYALELSGDFRAVYAAILAEEKHADYSYE
jgi:hypothetical protein